MPDDELRAVLARAAEQFNEGRFFECHDTIEELWSSERGPSRSFLQGLIQVAVAFYHLERGNARGAASQLRKALVRFDGYPDTYLGLDLKAHRSELQLWLACLEEGRPLPAAPEALPKWRFRHEPS